MSKSREQLNDFLRKINIQGKEVLDLGVQDKPTSRLTKGEAKQYWTLDVDPQWKPDFVQDLNKQAMLAYVEEETGHSVVISADIIFCIETLEHCWNPVQVLENIHSWLKEGGVTYISTPFINPHHDTHDYLRYTGEWYEKTLKELGFCVVKIHERRATTGRVLLQEFYRAEGMKYSKIRQKRDGAYTYPVGYFVEAWK